MEGNYIVYTLSWRYVYYVYFIDFQSMEVINQRKTGGRHHTILVSENWAADRSGAVATLHAVDH
jgi:hypothetical protein